MIIKLINFTDKGFLFEPTVADRLYYMIKDSKEETVLDYFGVTGSSYVFYKKLNYRLTKDNIKFKIINISKKMKKTNSELLHFYQNRE